MDFTPAEQAAIQAHATALGISSETYIHHSAARRALAWQREQEALHKIAQRHGVDVEELLRRGSLNDDDL